MILVFPAGRPCSAPALAGGEGPAARLLLQLLRTLWQTGDSQRHSGVEGGEVSYALVLCGDFRTVFKRTSRNDSPFLLQLHVFKQKNESVLFQPSQFLCRNLANGWE